MIALPPFDGALSSAVELADVLDHVPALVGYWDRELRNRFLNWAALDWFGKRPDELLDIHLGELLGSDRLARNRPYIDRVLAGERQSFERTAGERQAHVEYTPYVRGDDLVGFFSFATDISARVAAETSRRRIAAQLAMIAERERVAAGMEEAVISRLTDIASQLGAPELFSPAAAQGVAAAGQLVATTLEQLRAALQGPAESAPPLADTLREAVEISTRALGFAPRLGVHGQLSDVAPVIAAELIAVLVEALSNVARHAAASSAEVTVTVEGDGGEVVLTVADDGRGLTRPGRRSGLANMQERALRLGGSCAWRANEPSGTIVEWHAPVERRAARPGAPRAPWQNRRASDPMPSATPVGTAVLDPDRGPASVQSPAAELLDLLDHLPVVITAWDTELRNQFANKAGYEWVNCSSRADLLGRTLADVLEPAVQADILPVARAALSGTPQLFERTTRDDRHIRVSWQPRCSAAAARGAYAYIFDCTAQVQAEARLRDSTKQMIVLRERQRIAEDLHDVVIQHLFAAGLKLDAAREVGTGDDIARIDTLTTAVDAAIDDLRASIASLRS